jgi:hypothetical protein
MDRIDYINYWKLKFGIWERIIYNIEIFDDDVVCSGGVVLKDCIAIFTDLINFTDHDYFISMARIEMSLF